MRLIALSADDAQALAALRRATPSLLRPLLRLLARRRRRGPIDTFLAALAEAGDDRLEALLPFGSPEIVQRHLETATGRAGAVEWRRLARWHPDLAAGALRPRAEAATAADARLLW